MNRSFGVTVLIGFAVVNAVMAISFIVLGDLFPAVVASIVTVVATYLALVLDDNAAGKEGDGE